MIIRDIDEMFNRLTKQFLLWGYKEMSLDVDEIRYAKDGKSAIIGKYDDCVQIHSKFTFCFSPDIMPYGSIIALCGNSIFYYGRLEENDQ